MIFQRSSRVWFSAQSTTVWMASRVRVWSLTIPTAPGGALKRWLKDLGIPTFSLRQYILCLLCGVILQLPLCHSYRMYLVSIGPKFRELSKEKGEFL